MELVAQTQKAIRKELAGRYQRSAKKDRGRILDELFSKGGDAGTRETKGCLCCRAEEDTPEQVAGIP